MNSSSSADIALTPQEVQHQAPTQAQWDSLHAEAVAAVQRLVDWSAPVLEAMETTVPYYEWRAMLASHTAHETALKALVNGQRVTLPFPANRNTGSPTSAEYFAERTYDDRLCWTAEIIAMKMDPDMYDEDEPFDFDTAKDKAAGEVLRSLGIYSDEELADRAEREAAFAAGDLEGVE